MLKSVNVQEVPYSDRTRRAERAWRRVRDNRDQLERAEMSLDLIVQTLTIREREWYLKRTGQAPAKVDNRGKNKFQPKEKTT